MSKYGMTEEEWVIYSTAYSRDEVPEDWLDYSWDLVNDNGYIESTVNWFPNERVAKAYFAAHGITNYYLETV